MTTYSCKLFLFKLKLAMDREKPTVHLPQNFLRCKDCQIAKLSAKRLLNLVPDDTRHLVIPQCIDASIVIGVLRIRRRKLSALCFSSDVFPRGHFSRLKYESIKYGVCPEEQPQPLVDLAFVLNYIPQL